MTFRIGRSVTVRPPAHKSVQRWAAVLAVFLYVLVCLVGFLTLVQPNIDGTGAFRLGADSGTYLELADLMRHGGDAEVALIGLSGNYFGPVLVALALQSGFLIALFNMLMYGWALYAAGKIEGVDPWLFALLLMLNMETFVSAVTLNKEVFALLSAVLFARYLYSERRSVFMLALILLAALFARWQQVVITLMFLALARGGRSRRHPIAILAGIVVLVGIAYPLALSGANLTSFTEQGETGGGITILNTLQAHYLYPVTVFPKVAMNLFGQLLSPKYFFGAYWDKDFHDLQNQFAIQLHTVAMLFVCAVLWWQRKVNLREPLIFFCALYLALTAATPFIQPRYQYPVYGLLCIEIARKRGAGTAAALRAQVLTPEPAHPYGFSQPAIAGIPSCSEPV